jgi:hypothetical protein
MNLCNNAIVLACFLFALPSCERAGAAQYAVQMSNRTGRELSDVRVKYPDGFSLKFGVMVVGGVSMRDAVERAIPEALIIEWTEQDQTKSATAKIGTISADFDGTLKLVIHPDGTVTAEAVPRRRRSAN